MVPTYIEATSKRIGLEVDSRQFQEQISGLTLDPIAPTAASTIREYAGPISAAVRYMYVFAFGCFFSLLFAIFAIIPKTNYPKTRTGEIDRKSPIFNPLFFGHFAHIDVDEYKEDYAHILCTDDRIYDALAGDIYGQGKVLALSKYKYLKWSYNSFLGGMGAAIIVFIFQETASFWIELGTWVVFLWDASFWTELGTSFWNAIVESTICKRAPHSQICSP